MSRFTTDDIFTSSTTNQQSIVRSGSQTAAAQPAVAAGETYAAAAVQAGSDKVGRSSLPPVTSASPRAAAVAAAEPVKRKVAVKLVKTGMDSKSVLARFEVERLAPPHTRAGVRPIPLAEQRSRPSHLRRDRVRHRAMALARVSLEAQPDVLRT